MFLAISGGLQIYPYVDRKREKKCSLTNEICFQCIRVGAAPDADMSTVLVLAAC